MATSMTYYKVVAHHALGDKCSNCGSTTSLILHHIDLNRENNILENLQLLCFSCHRALHAKNNPLKLSKRSSTAINIPNGLLKELWEYVDLHPFWEDAQTVIVSAIRDFLLVRGKKEEV